MCALCAFVYSRVCPRVWCVCGAGRRCYNYWAPFLGAGGRGRKNTWMTLDSSTPTSPRSYTNTNGVK